MAAFVRCCRVSSLSFCSHIGRKTQPGMQINDSLKLLRQCSVVLTRIPTMSLHSSVVNRGLMEFFDDEKNWGESVVKVGRPWLVEEMRIKSDSDLHKLWYVLLKEKNMLLTMEHAYNQEAENIPSPDRIDKIELSMTNLETVVKERNQAYYELETGNYSEVPKLDRSTPFRHLFCPVPKEHPIPQHMNEKWQKERVEWTGRETRVFAKLMARKLLNEKLRTIRRQRNQVIKILKRCPDADEEAIKAKYPHADLVEIKRRYMW